FTKSNFFPTRRSSDLFGDVVDRQGFAVPEELTVDVATVGTPEQAHRELGAPGTHQSGHAHDLAGPQAEIGPVHHAPPRLGGVIHRPASDLEAFRPDLTDTLGIALVEVATDHPPDDAALVDRRLALCAAFHDEIGRAHV